MVDKKQRRQVSVATFKCYGAPVSEQNGMCGIDLFVHGAMLTAWSLHGMIPYRVSF